MIDQIQIVTTTVQTREQADGLAERAVQSGLAACAQVESGLTSHYVWEGKLEKASEYRIVFKLAPDKLGSLASFLMQNHPYECPQILSWMAVSANPDYTRWVVRQ